MQAFARNCIAKIFKNRITGETQTIANFLKVQFMNSFFVFLYSISRQFPSDKTRPHISAFISVCMNYFRSMATVRDGESFCKGHHFGNGRFSKIIMFFLSFLSKICLECQNRLPRGRNKFHFKNLAF